MDANAPANVTTTPAGADAPTTTSPAPATPDGPITIETDAGTIVIDPVTIEPGEELRPEDSPRGEQLEETTLDEILEEEQAEKEREREEERIRKWLEMQDELRQHVEDEEPEVEVAQSPYPEV